MELTPTPEHPGPRYPAGTPAFTTPITSPKALPAEALYHFWNPDRDGVERVPAHFATRLAEIHGDITMVKPPMGAPTPSHPWLMWYRKPAVTYWLSPGWVLLFVWQTRDGEPLPLDNRIFANLYRISARAFGNGVRYFDSIVGQMQKEKAAREKADQNHRHDHAADYYEFTKIKSSGRGNKFALHHDGTILPGRSEANWVHEQGDRALPGEVAIEQRHKHETKREFNARQRGRYPHRRRR